jgi:hypothetical protein
MELMNGVGSRYWNYQSGPCMNLTGQDLREEQEFYLESSLLCETVASGAQA